jgi:flagellar biosynthetic protein FliR
VTINLAPELLAGFLFALVRSGAWMLLTPPFSSSAIPVRVKVAISAALAFTMAPSLDADPEILQFWPFFSTLVYQAVVGLALGFVVLLVFSAVQAAGEMVDFSAGFSAASMYDPLSNASSSPIGRLYQLLAITILFAINGHLLLVRGFIGSFEAAPISGLRFDDLGRLLTRDLVTFLVSALEIAAPLLAALFMAEVVMGLLGRAAPQANVMVVGFAIKILLVLVLVGLAMPVLPGAVSTILDRAVRHGFGLAGG